MTKAAKFISQSDHDFDNHAWIIKLEILISGGVAWDPETERGLKFSSGLVALGYVAYKIQLQFSLF
jgi:hypothetical protein